MDEHPLDLSARIIDNGITGITTTRVTEELSELTSGVALIESFSHVIVVDSGDGLVVFDTSVTGKGPAVVDALRSWSGDRVDTVVYTHGHIDHVGGSGAFAADAAATEQPRPRFVGHANIAARLERYRTMSGYNRVINLRQFGGAATDFAEAVERPFLDASVVEPDTTYDRSLSLTVGDLDLEFYHCRGETDDHTWTWIPDHHMIAAGDQFIWNFPNCGNPQKVQRYPLEWARSLRDMAEKKPELFVPAHGLPIAGAVRIQTCLLTVAETLEALVADVVDAMNAGASLDDIIHSVSVPAERLNLPYLVPLYDEPEFVIRNIWRLYGGWYDGNPGRLKPAPDSAVGAEIVALIGSIDIVVERALELSSDGDHRLACHLIELAVSAQPASRPVHEARRAIYLARRSAESSLMAKGVFAGAAADSEHVLTGDVPRPNVVLSM